MQRFFFLRNRTRGFSLSSSATESFTINGDGISNGGAIINTGTTPSTLAGTVTLNSSSRINASSNAITLEGNVIGGNNVLFVGGAYNTTLSAVVGGAGAAQNGTTTSVYKDGAGILTLSGTNTYTGDTRIVQGNLTVSSTGNLGSGSDVFISSEASLTVNNSVTVASVQETANTNGGTVSIASGSTLTIDGANKGTIYQNSISGSGGLTMSGSGTTELVLYGTQSYTGITSVTGGKLSTGVALSSSDLRVSGGILQMNETNVLSNTATLLLSGGTFSTGSGVGYAETLGVLTISGGGTSTIALGTGSHNLNFSASNGATWSGTLSITGWNGTTGRIYVGSSSSGLTPTQLTNITFSGFDAGAILLDDGELVPSTIHSITGISASPNNGSGVNAYNGSTITVTGSNFTSGLTITMQNGGAISSYSSTVPSQITFTLPVGYSGTITITKNGAPKTSSGSITNLGYITAQNGDWGTNTTWLGAAVPPANSIVTVDHNISVNTTVANSPTTVTINSSDVLTFSAGNFSLTATTLNNNGTINMVNGSTIIINGTMNNVGTLNMVTNSRVNMSNNTSWTGNGTIGANGEINFSNGNISSTSTFPNVNIQSGSVNFKASVSIESARIGTTLQFLPNSFINTHSPFYNNGSILIYNTVGNYNRGPEWGQAIAGLQGFPHHVRVEQGTNVILDNGNPPNVEIAGDLTILGTVSMGTLVIPLRIGGNLVIGNSSISSGSSLTLSSATNGDLWLNGNFIRHNSNSFFYGSRAVYLKGTGNAEISTPGATIVNGNPTQFFNLLFIDKTPTSIITLGCRVGIETRITFTKGILESDYTNLLVINNNATAVDAGNDSFVDGPVRKIGNQAFTFPVGKPITGTSPQIGGYRRLTISAPGDAADAFTCEFYTGSAFNLGSTLTAPLKNISGCEYWRLDRDFGNSPVNVTLSWSLRSKCNSNNYVTSLNSLVVASGSSSGIPFSNNGIWTSLGQDSRSGDETSGTITANNVSTFSPFALGSTSFTQNPLPFYLLSFTGKIAATQAQLDWSAGGNDEQKEYWVEHSTDGVNFKVIQVVAAKPVLEKASYTSFHPNPSDGWNFYRITAVALDGDKKQTHIVRLYFGKAAKISLSPNPVSSSLNLTILEPEKVNAVSLYNAAGQFLKEFRGLRSSQTIDVSQYPAGHYLLRILSQKGVVTIPFVKQ